MTLDDSLFVSDTLHEKQVTLPDGSTHTFHFRELPQQDFMQYREEQASEDAEIRRLAPAKLIAKSLVNPDGTPAMDFGKAATLKLVAAQALLRAVMEANNFVAKKPSPSEAESGSSSS